MFNPNDNPIFYSNMTDDEVRDDDAEYEAMMQADFALDCATYDAVSHNQHGDK